MDINAPFGFKEIIPFYKNQKISLPANGAMPDFLRSANAVPISFTEFPVAFRDFPLVFVSTDEGKTFSPVAVLGVANTENLFLDNGVWDVNAYLPAYVRRYPFCMARVTMDSVEQADRLVCVEKAFVDEKGESMFDGEGNALPRWEPISRLLNDYEADLERTREMCAILSDYSLLEPFTLQANLKDGGPMNLAGMYRVEEKKLEFLNAAQHRNLFKKGVMGRIYTHLLSLDNFARLLQRKGNQAPAKAA